MVCKHAHDIQLIAFFENPLGKCLGVLLLQRVFACQMRIGLVGEFTERELQVFEIHGRCKKMQLRVCVCVNGKKKQLQPAASDDRAYSLRVAKHYSFRTPSRFSLHLIYFYPLDIIFIITYQHHQIVITHVVIEMTNKLHHSFPYFKQLDYDGSL